MNTYLYFDVRPKGMNVPYFYLYDEMLSAGTPVEIPFGKHNNIISGIISGVLECDEDEVPYPLESTKYIIRPLTMQEYREANGCISPKYGKNYPVIKEAYECWQSGDIDEMYQWAILHDNYHDSDEIMDIVGQFYRAAMDGGIADAALNLGAMYYNGIYYDQDYQKAVKLYEKAAFAGSVQAICNLGYCYYYGRHQEVDYQKAYQYFNTAGLIFNDANALYKLGDMYASGLYVEQNSTYAIKLYYRALDAAEGDRDHYCLPDIQLRLGRALLNGEGQPTNYLGAYSYLSDAMYGYHIRKLKGNDFASKIKETKSLLLKSIDLMDAENFENSAVINIDDLENGIE